MAMTPMRGSEGYDFTPILTHYVFLLTSVLAIVSVSSHFPQRSLNNVLKAGWFVAFIGQIIAQAKCNSINGCHASSNSSPPLLVGSVAHQQVGVLWFAILYVDLR